ncbi:MAG: hypothetical protein V4684_14420 [Pseudomonadota bacterium]
MNRFLPDTWREALLRPIAMASPDGNVYVEIMAPDLRFVFIALLAIVWLISARRAQPRPLAPLVMLGFVTAAFVPWLATSGNGRYFLPILLAAGPLCIAIVYWIPWSRFVRLSVALGILTLQTAVAVETRPWVGWNLGAWGDGPSFDIALSPRFRETPGTFITITSMSYSLIAPAFHPKSNWINISVLHTDETVSQEARKAHAIFRNAPVLHLIVPSKPAYMTPEGLPRDLLLDEVDRQIGPQRLAVDRSQTCELAPSRGLARVAIGHLEKASSENVSRLGFWICKLRYPVAVAPAAPLDASIEDAFDQIEKSCPRFFPPRTASTSPVANGRVRNYAGVDMKLYVLDDGNVYYKYWRAMSPVLIASAQDVVAPGYKMTCDNIRGRSGLPWERVL